MAPGNPLRPETPSSFLLTILSVLLVVVAFASDAQGARTSDGLVAYYPFSEGVGTKAFDQAHAPPYTDLTLQGSVAWVGTTNGVVFTGGKVGTLAAATPLIDLLQASSEGTFELWISGAPLNQVGPARMMAFGTGPSDVDHDYLLGQQNGNVATRLRHTGKTGFDPRITTTDDPLGTGLFHIVHVFDGVNEFLYINGAQHPTTVSVAGSLTNWSDLDYFSLGNNSTNEREWVGTMRMAAIYDKALSPAEVLVNFSAGPDVAIGPGAPSVDAGPDAVNPSAPGRALLTAHLDGVVDNPAGGLLTIQWSLISGPTPVVFADDSVAQTTASLPSAGVYVFELSATNDVRESTDEVTITVPTATTGVAALNVFPLDQATGVSTNPTLEAACLGVAPEMGQVIIGTDSSFSSLVYDSGLSPRDVCSFVAFANLNDLTEYDWAARQKDGFGLWSDWSSPTRFTTGRADTTTTLSYQYGVDGYFGSQDADIRGDAINVPNVILEWNQGGQDVLRTGRRPPGSPEDEIFRSLLHFDVTGVDPNQVINAHLELTGWMHGANPVFHHGANSFYELLVDWNEARVWRSRPPKLGKSAGPTPSFQSPGPSPARRAWEPIAVPIPSFGLDSPMKWAPSTTSRVPPSSSWFATGPPSPRTTSA